MPLDDIDTVEAYLSAFGRTLAARVAEKYPPLYDPRAEPPHPCIAELDCNPVIVSASGAVVVDARVRIAAPRPRHPIGARR